MVGAVEMVAKCNGHAAAEMSGARTRPADRLASASVWSRFTFDWVAPPHWQHLSSLLSSSGRRVSHKTPIAERAA